MDQARIRGQSLGLLVMLGIQFVLGMIINLFVKLPNTHPGTTGNFGSRAVHGFIWAISNGAGIALLLHIVVAIGLLLGSLALVIRAAVARSQAWLAVSIIGALGIITALTNGLAFIGYNSDATSFVMAMGFLTAALAYAFGLALAPVFSISEISNSSRKQTAGSKQRTGGRFHIRPAKV
jgi:hypothetical protein